MTFKKSHNLNTYYRGNNVFNKIRKKDKTLLFNNASAKTNNDSRDEGTKTEKKEGRGREGEGGPAGPSD